MKKIASLILAAAFSLGTLAQADDVVIAVAKAGDTTAKVGTLGSDKTAVVPISFDSGADWTAVKDSYTVSSDTAAALAAKKETISIGTDGTASFHAVKAKKK